MHALFDTRDFSTCSSIGHSILNLLICNVFSTKLVMFETLQMRVKRNTSLLRNVKNECFLRTWFRSRKIVWFGNALEDRIGG
jgi:hypothetical protein